MKPTSLSKYLLLTFAALTLPLSGCEPPVERSILADDLNLMVGQTVDLNDYVTFLPADSVDTLTFRIVEGATLVEINANNYLTALEVGVATIEAATVNTMVKDQFTVSITESNEHPWENFNADGTFDEGFGDWVLTGETRTLHTVEVDADREMPGQAFKLWTGDYSADPAVSSLVDVGLGYEFTDTLLVSGTYTLMFDLVGSITTIELTLNGTTYTRANEELLINSVEYVTNYIVFELTDATIDFLLYFHGDNGNANWGFLDNVKIEAGDLKPIVEENKSIVLDGGFETIGSKQGDFSQQTAWSFAGAFGVNTWGNNLKFNSDAARTGSYGLNYWHGTSTEDDFTISQVITVVDGAYSFSFDIYSGAYSAATAPNTSVILRMGDSIILNEFLTPSSSGFTTRTFDGLATMAGDLTLEIRIHALSGDIWIKLDNISLVLAN